MNAPERINYPAASLVNVWLQSGFEISSGAWGKTVRYADLAGLGAAILCAVVLKSARLTGPEIAYLRRKLDLSQAECARVMGVEEQTLSLWERGKHLIPVPTDALLRRICIEELRTAFPRKTRFPRISALVQLATSTRQGEYVATFEDGRWAVFYQGAQSEQLTANPVTSTNVFTLSKLPVSYHGLAKYGSVAAGFARMYQVLRAPHHSDDLPPLEIFAGGTRSSMPVEIEGRPVKMRLLQGGARGLIEDTYDVNRENGALFIKGAPLAH